MFDIFLTSLVKFVSLNNQKYEIQPTVTNLHPNEYNKELHYYPFHLRLNQIDALEVVINTLN